VAVWSVARERLRRRRVATFGLIALAGLSAAIPVAVWSASRYASTAFVRFVDAAQPSDSGLVVCPPDLDLQADAGPSPCFAHEVTTELDVIRADRQVRGAARFAYRPVDLGPSRDPSELRSFSIGTMSLEDPAPEPTPAGDPIVVAGRLARADAPAEAMISETAVDRLRVGAGDRVWVRFSGSGDDLVPVTITGVIRTPTELLPLGAAGSGPALVTRPGFLVSQRSKAPTMYGGIAVWLHDGDVEGLVQRLGRQLDQLVVSYPLVPPDEAATITQATDFESRAGAAIAGAAAIVALFFVGQAVSRQARSESLEAPTLVTLGLTRRDLMVASAVRWLPVALGAAALMLVVAIAASALGPLGVARRGVWERELRFDWPALTLGASGLFVLVLVVGWFGSRPAGAASDVPSPAPVGVSSPSVATGLGLAWHGVRRGATLPLVSAVVASALAVAAIITAAGGTASLRLVTDEPHRFGAPWDALANSSEGDNAEPTELAGIDGVDHAALIGGTDVAIKSDPMVWTQTFFPIEGVPVSEPVIVEGRAPVADDEVALGTLTLERAGAQVGDRVQLKPPGDARLRTFEVVGVAMVTDGAEPNVGHGAVVTPGGMNSIEVGTLQTAVLGVSVADGADRARTLARLRDLFPSLVAPFPVPNSLLNAERVAGLPLLFALVAAMLAGTTFAHALVVSVRRSRRELAVCRVLGFTHGQVWTAVATQATVLAIAAIAVGIPLGVIGARWGWRALADAFGLVTEPRVPVAATVACLAGVLLLANLTAAPAAWSAARKRTAEVLRSE
jgi:hypothetical protein